MFPVISFFENNTFLMTEKFNTQTQSILVRSSGNQLNNTPLERESYGTWSLVINVYGKFINLVFDDEEEQINNRSPTPKAYHKKLTGAKDEHHHHHHIHNQPGPPKGLAKFGFENSNQLKCEVSLTHRIVREFLLIKASDEGYV